MPEQLASEHLNLPEAVTWPTMGSDGSDAVLGRRRRFRDDGRRVDRGWWWDVAVGIALLCGDEGVMLDTV